MVSERVTDLGVEGVLDAVEKADPEAAAEKERAAGEEEFVRVGRCNQHGQKTM